MKLQREIMANIYEKRLLKEVLPKLLSNAERGLNEETTRNKQYINERDRDWLLD